MNDNDVILIVAGLGSGDSQQKKIRNLQKDVDYQREKVTELEKELKMVHNGIEWGGSHLSNLLFV